MRFWFTRPRASRPEAKSSAPAYGFVALHAQGEAHWSRRDYATLARTGFMANPVAHRAVKLVAEAAGSVPLIAYRGSEELIEHPALALLARPNQRQAGSAFFETLYGHLLISGNAYLELVEAGAQRELHLLRPDRVSVVADASGWPVALDHAVNGRKRRITLGERALHIAMFHPLDDHYGLAPLEAALTALDIHNAAGRWNKALLDNSARPSGALVFGPSEGGGMEPEQHARLKKHLEEDYAGAARAGRPLLLEGGLDWKPMSLTPKDMDFIEAKNGASRDIALALGVPPMLLGIPGDNTYANYAEANRSFWRLTVLPLLGRILKELSAWLGPQFDDLLGEPPLRLWFDADQVDGLSQDRNALWARISAADFLNDDEKREAVGWGNTKAHD